MSYSSKDWRDAITKLIKKTSEKEISWEHSNIFEADQMTEVDRSFKCTINDKTYVVSATRSRHYIDEDEFYWVDDCDFSIFMKERAQYILLASAPADLNIVGSLYSVAEKNFAYSVNALGDLLD